MNYFLNGPERIRFRTVFVCMDVTRNIKNLGVRTDLIRHKKESIILEKENYFLIKTPSRPTYFWGNFLIMKEAPSKGCYKDWMRRYESEFSSKEQGFTAIGWDGNEPGDSSEFTLKGFTFCSFNTLVLNKVIEPKKLNSSLELRPISKDSDWEQLLLLNNRSDEEEVTSTYIISKVKGQKESVAEGRSIRYGAFLDGKLVGDMGILFDGEIGRFNSVTTHNKFRNQGVCTTLLNGFLRFLVAEISLEKMVIVCDQGTQAERIYTRAGFEYHESHYGLEWFDESRFNPKVD